MSDIRIAVDLGTTNIEIALVDGLTKEVISTRIIKNRQSLYGSDVINRIAATIRDKKHLFTMRQMVISDLKDAFIAMLKDKGYKTEDVGSISICGNTTMISILLSYDIEDMGTYPFSHRLEKSLIVQAKSLFYDLFKEDTKVFLSGCVSAFIGGDILAGMYYLQKDEDLGLKTEDVTLFIDMGTNGEMILFKDGRYYGTSTACGPAFEGCTRKQSVYGASTIDAISLGIASKKISREGILDKEYIEKGITISGVYLDTGIIEDILVAKAGIYTGINLLAKYAGLSLADIDNIYIAGGFGFNLNLDSAFNLGLLPECFKEKIKVVGNTCIKGATLIVGEVLGVPHTIDTYEVDVLQLANDENFQNELMENMSFARK